MLNQLGDWSMGKEIKHEGEIKETYKAEFRGGSSVCSQNDNTRKIVLCRTENSIGSGVKCIIMTCF